MTHGEYPSVGTDWRLQHRELFVHLKRRKVSIDDLEYEARSERLELGRLLIEGVESDVPIAKMARAAGVSRETAYKLMRRYWQDQRESADTFQEWDRFEDWLASLRSTTRKLLEKELPQ
jgi:hypothetical protein